MQFLDKSAFYDIQERVCISNVEKEDSDENEEKERGPKDLKEDESVEKCTEKEASNRVKVCVPKFTTDSSPVQLYSGEVVEERHFFDV